MLPAAFPLSDDQSRSCVLQLLHTLSFYKRHCSLFGLFAASSSWSSSDGASLPLALIPVPTPPTPAAAKAPLGTTTSATADIYFIDKQAIDLDTNTVLTEESTVSLMRLPLRVVLFPPLGGLTQTLTSEDRLLCVSPAPPPYTTTYEDLTGEYTSAPRTFLYSQAMRDTLLPSCFNHTFAITEFLTNSNAYSLYFAVLPKELQLMIFSYVLPLPNLETDSSLGHRADVRAVVLLAYTLVTGLIPFAAETEREVIMHMLAPEKYFRDRLEEAELLAMTTPSFRQFIYASVFRLTTDIPTAEECLRMPWLSAGALSAEAAAASNVCT